MNTNFFGEALARNGGRPATLAARGPGEYVGTTWRGADPSPTLLRWVLHALLLAVAFLLLMGFYTVVRGAVARGPAVVAAAPASMAAAPSAEREERECDSALQGTCVAPPANTLTVRAAPRIVSLETR